ncbi:hypothetical protein [Geobacillus sp. JS12]|uniref:hypothetical protein n=1 Tax=Geobacillus sp. JS12 TaxID=1813182 RepID=UPI0013E3F266|nr:hypothetical protein [Geobacillus sp. JS12]
MGNLVNQLNIHLDNIELWKEFKIPIETCKHQNDAGMIGALYHWKRREGLVP